MLLVDYTHLLNRKITGIERLSQDLFSPEILGDLDTTYVQGGSTLRMMVQQWLGIPFRLLRNRTTSVLFPGFPPAISVSALFGRRVWVYIFDLFLLTRKQDLNWKARLYMAPSLYVALKLCKKFLVLSETVGEELRPLCRRDATIVVYRAPARNVFRLDYQERRGLDEGRPIRLLSIGTVEPRKNYLAAADIRRSLQRQIGRPVELHIVGRPGWGGHYEALSKQEGVTLHGFLDDLEMRALVDSCDAYLYTTHAEGLGLPVLEVQHSGIPVISNDLPVLRESLNNSGLFIDADDTEQAAKTIYTAFEEEDFFPRMSRKSADNVRRWNDQANGDRERMLTTLRSWHTSQG